MSAQRHNQSKQNVRFIHVQRGKWANSQTVDAQRPQPSSKTIRTKISAVLSSHPIRHMACSYSQPVKHTTQYKQNGQCLSVFHKPSGTIACACLGNTHILSVPSTFAQHTKKVSADSTQYSRGTGMHTLTACWAQHSWTRQIKMSVPPLHEHIIKFHNSYLRSVHAQHSWTIRTKMSVPPSSYHMWQMTRAYSRPVDPQHRKQNFSMTQQHHILSQLIRSMSYACLPPAQHSWTTIKKQNISSAISSIRYMALRSHHLWRASTVGKHKSKM